MKVNASIYLFSYTDQKFAAGHRPTVLAMHPSLSAGDIAVHIVGEYQRQFEQIGSDQTSNNAELRRLQDVLNKMPVEVDRVKVRPTNPNWGHK